MAVVRIVCWGVKTRGRESWFGPVTQRTTVGPCLESPADGLQGEASVHCLPPPSVLRAPPFCLLSAALVYVLMRRNIFTISSSFFFLLLCWIHLFWRKGTESTFVLLYFLCKYLTALWRGLRALQTSEREEFSLTLYKWWGSAFGFRYSLWLSGPFSNKLLESHFSFSSNFPWEPITYVKGESLMVFIFRNGRRTDS